MKNMQNRVRIIDVFSDDVFLKRCFGLLVLLLFIWSVFTVLCHRQSYEAVISSSRLVIETFLVFTLLKFKLIKREMFINAILVLSIINSVVVFIQLMEGIGCFSTNFSWIITDFWHLHEDLSRKPGIFNGFLTSSFFSFMAIAMIGERKKSILNTVILLVALIPIIFGARTFLVFVPIVLLLNARLLICFLVISTVVLTFFYSTNKGFFDSHIDDRLSPVVSVVVNLDPTLDPSSKDLFKNHYRFPKNVSELLMGNGFPRYFEVGGKDASIMRWVLQAGLPAAVIVFLISFLICLRIALIGTSENIVFALALCLTMIKGELITSAICYAVLFSYIFVIPSYFGRGLQQKQKNSGSL